MRAKSIDRLALTRAKFGAKMYGDEPVKGSKSTPLDEHIGEVNEMIKTHHREGYSICPNCGQETLIHEDGCKHCRSCGWSACG